GIPHARNCKLWEFESANRPSLVDVWKGLYILKLCSGSRERGAVKDVGRNIVGRFCFNALVSQFTEELLKMLFWWGLIIFSCLQIHLQLDLHRHWDLFLQAQSRLQTQQ